MQQRSARDPSRKKKSFFREGQLPQELYGRRMRPIGPRVLPVGIYFNPLVFFLLSQTFAGRLLCIDGNYAMDNRKNYKCLEVLL